MDLADSILRAKRDGKAPVVAEIKRLIPKLELEQGRRRDERDAAGLAALYEQGGAAGVSLVTEQGHFGGQPEVDVPAVLRATSLPLLIKDFTFDRDRVDFYATLVERCGGADPRRVTLLLTAHWLEQGLADMLAYVHSKNMLALVETRSPDDLHGLGGLRRPPRLVGINNKDIDELETGEDCLRLTPDMVGRYRSLIGDSLLMSQSAHRQPEDVRRSIETGADAVLVGTAFMTSPDPAATVASFVRALEGRS